MMRTLMRWLVAISALVAVFALHVLTVEDAPQGTNGAPATATASSTVASADRMMAIDPTVLASPQIAAVLDGPALGDAPVGPLQEPWAAGCLLFLAALWVMAVLRRPIPLRPPTQASWWPGPVAGPPLWPMSRLSLGVTRI